MGNLHAQTRQIRDKLFETDGPVNRWDLVDMLKPGRDQEHTVRTHIHTLRAHYGFDAIRSVWGYGYQLTETGRRLVGEAA